MSREVNENNDNEWGLLIASLVALPLVLAWVWAPRLTGRKRAWQWPSVSRTGAALAVVASTVLTVLVARWAVLSLLARQWQLTIMLVLVMWVVELPWAALLVVVRLRRFATQLEHGRIAPNRSGPARIAMRDAAFQEAEAYFQKCEGVLPSLSDCGDPVVGVVAEPRDFRHSWERWLTPAHHRLTEFSDGPYAVMPMDWNSPSHHLVIGATGSGKTTLLIRMAHAALSKGFRVAVLDMKGAEQEAQAYLNLANRLGPLVRTRHWPGQALDLWRGTPNDIAERVMGFIPAPAAGGSEFYRARIQRGINSVVVRTSAAVPRSATELTERVRKAASYAEDAEDRAVLLSKEHRREVCVSVAEALGSYLDPLRQAGPKATNGGFSWEDGWDLAVISIDATSEPDLRLGAAVLHDFDSWSRSARREMDPRPMLLIIDEAGALGRINGAPALTNLIARARSARVGVVVASQTLSSLGQDGEEVLNTGPVRWLGQTSAPELMSMAGGTRRVVETGHQDGVGGLTGVRALREQAAFVVDPDDARTLPTFYWIVGKAGRAAHIYAPPL
jgi:hypothetical protein